jgi:hypothetical protein
MVSFVRRIAASPYSWALSCGKLLKLIVAEPDRHSAKSSRVHLCASRQWWQVLAKAVDIQTNIGIFRAAREEILKLEQPPVSTAVGVPEIARPGTLVEIEAIAVLWRSEYG